MKDCKARDNGFSGGKINREDLKMSHDLVGGGGTRNCFPVTLHTFNLEDSLKDVGLMGSCL